MLRFAHIEAGVLLESQFVSKEWADLYKLLDNDDSQLWQKAFIKLPM